MIILSPSLVLAPGALLNTPVFGWQSLVTTLNVTATSSDADHPVTNLANPSTALYWQAAPGSPAPDQYLTVDVNQIDPIDFLAVAGHNFGTGQIPVSVEIATALVGSPPALNWTEIAPDRLLGLDDPVLFRFAPTSVLGIRLRMQPGLEAPRAAVLYVGRLLVMPRGISDSHTPINLGRTVDRLRQVSHNGHYLGDIILSEGRTSSLPFKHLDPGWYRETMDQFVRAAHVEGRPFFVGWQPQEYPDDVGYCTLTNNPTPVEDFETETISVELAMEGAAV